MRTALSTRPRHSGAIFRPTRDARGVVAALPGVEVVSDEPKEGQVPVKVNVDGRYTQSTYDRVVRELAASTPVVPGFRKAKGGKNALIPSKVVVQMLGQKRVSGFVVQTIVTDVLADWAKDEGLKVDKEAKVDQEQDALLAGFKPGKPLEFTAKLNLQESDDAETSEGTNAEAATE